MPDVPTLIDEGIDVTGGSIYGLAAPAGTPDEVVQTLSDCFGEAFESDAFQGFLTKQGTNPGYQNAGDFTKYLGTEYTRYGDLIETLSTRT